MPDKILLMPLDERPCNYWYPRYVAPIGGVDLVMPPPEIMPKFRQTGGPNALHQWFLENIEKVDAAVVSVDLLGYGGLIPSRIGQEPLAEVLDRLEILREARRRKPDLKILGFNVIMRTSNSTVNTEEPEYWTPWGTTIFRISQLIDRVDRLGIEEEERELAELKARVPAEILQDYLNRRERNHAVNRAIIAMAADGVFDFVFLSQDDASEFGIPAREQRVLRADIREKNVGDKVVVYPGADEVGLVLLARAACGLAGYAPRFYPRWASTGGESIVALFEDRPLGQTVRGEVYCAGGITVESPREADIMLFLNTPGEAQDYPNRAAIAKTVETPARNLPDFLASLAYYAGYMQVAVADVAYCNGADPALAPLLPKFVNYPQLAAYGGWNTAANTIGTVVAHAAMRTLGLHHVEGGDAMAREAAHQTFLFYRLLEDWGYQAVIRTEVEEHLVKIGDNPYKLGDREDAVRVDIERRVQELAGRMFDEWFCDQGSSPDPTLRPEGWSIEKVTLPWNRTFEVGIECCVGVEAIAGDHAKD
ncbi:MAG TPA: DUF4127 family protein [Armatimonadota bacterium]|jgi:hypothetical protein